MFFLLARTQRVGTTKRLRSQPRRLLCATLALTLAQLAFATAADARGLEIKQPRADSDVSGTFRFSATVEGHPRKVAFYVDGERRWTDRSRPYTFGPRPVIDTASLSTGPHRLTVKAYYQHRRLRRDSVVVQVVRGRDGGGDEARSRDGDKGGTPPAKKSPVSEPPADPPATDPPSTEPPAGSLIWNGDFESGSFSQWEGVQQFTSSRSSVVSSPHKQGGHAARFEVREGEFTISSDADAPSRNRTEAILSPTKNRHNPKEGSDWWYRWWFNLPSSTPLPADGSTNYMAVLQHITTAPLGDPAWDKVGIMEFRDHRASGDPGPGHVELSYGGAAGPAPFSGPFWGMPASAVTRDAWHEIILRKKWSSNPAVGFVEIWYDGVKQTMKDGSTRVYHSNLKPGYSAYVKQGIYRSNAIGGTAVIYLDGLRIGTTRASVDG